MAWEKRRRLEVKYFNSIGDILVIVCKKNEYTFNYLCVLFVSYCAYITL